MTLFLSEQEAARLGLTGQTRSAKKAREARPNLPRAARAAPGDGDRVPDLMRLAAQGWVCTHYQAGAHWMTQRGGTPGPSFPTYRAMLDAMLLQEDV